MRVVIHFPVDLTGFDVCIAQVGKPAFRNDCGPSLLMGQTLLCLLRRVGRTMPRYAANQMAVRRRHRHACGRRGDGFTLMEVLMASVVLSLAVAAISQAVISGQSHTYDSVDRMHSAALAQALMEEVTALAYPVADEEGNFPARPRSRPLYDSVDDFADYEEAAGQLADQAGNDYPQAYQTFSRQVSVTASNLNVAGLGKVEGLQVQVTVTSAQGRTYQLVRFVPKPSGEASP